MADIYELEKMLDGKITIFEWIGEKYIVLDDISPIDILILPNTTIEDLKRDMETFEEFRKAIRIARMLSIPVEIEENKNYDIAIKYTDNGIKIKTRRNVKTVDELLNEIEEILRKRIEQIEAYLIVLKQNDALIEIERDP